MAETNERGWLLAGRVDIIQSLILGVVTVLGAGGISLAVIANAPLLVIIPLSFVLVILAAVLQTITVKRRLTAHFDKRFEEVTEQHEGAVRRMERIQDSFGALWDYANEKGLMEHAENDKVVREQLDELRLSIYGRPITPNLSADDKIPRPVRPELRNQRRGRGRR